jgi:hypothetical protein
MDNKKIIMEILRELEIEAVKSTELDDIINAYLYGPTLRFKLIIRIKTRITEALNVNIQEGP